FWVGDIAAVGNITQDMAQRGEATGLDRWRKYTAGLRVEPAGPGSEAIGGVGSLSYEDMLVYLRRIRAYLYLGTQPASYTLGLIEAMLSGVPVVPVSWNVPSLDWMWLAHLWEADEIVDSKMHPDNAPLVLRTMLSDKEYARHQGELGRARGLDLFDVAKI